MPAVERWPESANETAIAVEEPAESAFLPAPPIKGRFLFINVAAMRAKQLRRGAKPRVEIENGREKAERLAMEEIRRGLIPYQLLTA
jgi:DNA-directed RNA polymerase omega subunit